MPIHKKIKKAVITLKRGFKTRKLLNLADKAGNIAKKLKKTRGVEKRGTEKQHIDRIFLKRRARRLIKKISKLNK